MRLLKNGEVFEFDTAGYPVEFVCKCEAGFNKPHLHLGAEQTGDRGSLTEDRRQAPVYRHRSSVMHRPSSVSRHSIWRAA